MIPTKVERDIIRSGEFKERQMGIAKGQEAWIFGILRNKTYTDKIAAPIREYVCNALDEHAKAGKTDVPVEVTFPTAFAPELKIRDFGFGLSDDDVVKYFADYGASDKRESNDYIGAFGIGAKSAFAYTDSFTVVSYFNGRKATFNLYIDESEIGSIAQLAVETTDEPNGVEIIVPVKTQDVSQFVSRGLELMKYFKTKPSIKGVANVPSFEREASPVAGENWRYFGDNRGSVVIQGQIGYKFDATQMGQVSYADESMKIPAGQIYRWEWDLLNSGLEIEVSIGEVDVAASREGLEMNAKTIAAIRKNLARIREEIVDLVSEKFKNAKNLIEAKTAFYDFFQKGGSYGRTLASSVGKVRWNGQEITDSTIHLDATKHKVMQYKKKWNGDITLVTFDKIQCSDELNLYFDDTDRKMVNYRRRANTLLNAGAKQVTVLQTDDAKALLAETGIKVSTLAKYSKVVPTVIVSTRAAGNGVDLSKRVKHKLKVFQLDWKKLSGVTRIRGAKSDYWKVAEIEIDNQVYVPIDRFEPNGLFNNDLQQLRDSLADLNILGIDVENTPIYGVKSGQDVGEMVRLDEWAIAQAKSLPKLANEVAVINDFKTRRLFEFIIKSDKLPKGSLAADYATQYAAAVKLMDGSTAYTTTPSVRARLNLAELIKLELPNKGKLVTLSDQFKEKYPLIRFLSQGEQNMSEADIIDYVTLVDEARELAASAIQMAAAA